MFVCTPVPGVTSVREEVLVGKVEEGRRRKKDEKKPLPSPHPAQTDPQTQKCPLPGQLLSMQQGLGVHGQGAPSPHVRSSQPGGALSPHMSCLRAAEGGPDPGISTTLSCIWHRARLHLQAAHSVCTSHNAELSLLEKDRALFLVLLSTVHFICLLNRSIFVFPGGFSGC